MSRKLVVRTQEQIDTLRAYAAANELPVDIYENFVVYAHYMVPLISESQLEWEWFHYYVAKHFQQVIDGELSFLTLEISPQHGKTLLCALFLTYVFGCNPNKRIIYMTYNEVRATEFTKDVLLGLMGTQKYKTIFPHIILKNELDKKDNTSKGTMQRKRATFKDNEFTLAAPFENISYHGKYVALGIGQGSHGKSGDIYMIDDYVAKAENIYSENFRKKLENWFFSDVISRLQAEITLIIACTRWYYSDPVGLLTQKLDELKEQFEEHDIEPLKIANIKIRAEYRLSDENPPEDPRKIEGQWLWKQLIPKYLLAKGSDNFDAMYNQDPMNEDMANQVRPEDFGYYSQLPEHGIKVISIDGASTIGKRSDYTGITVWIINGRKRYLHKIYYVKKEIPDLIDYVQNILTNDHPDYNYVLIEFANAGQALYQFLKDNYANIIPLGFTGKSLNSDNPTDKMAIKSSNSKIDRYARCIPEFKHPEKRILLPENPIEHQKEFIRQMINFTGEKGRKDDLVDSATYMIYYTAVNTIVASKRQTNIKPNPLYGNMNYGMSNGNYFAMR